MAVETFKAIDKRIITEYVDPLMLQPHLKAGWYLTKEEAVAAVKPKPEVKVAPKVTAKSK